MKKLAVILLFASALFSCVSKSAADKIQNEKDSLATVVLEKEAILSDVFNSLNTISENLDNIKSRENIVTAGSQSELTPEIKEKINADIEAIDNLLAENRKAIENLKYSTERLRQAKIKIGKLEELVANLTRQVDAKDGEIMALKAELETMDIKITDLEQAVDGLGQKVAGLHSDKQQLETRVNQQVDQLNTAFYIVDKEATLLSDGIVVKSGFISRTLKINGRYDLNKFHRVNVKTLGEIEIGQSKVTVVSSHPENSYELVANKKGFVEKLIITDAPRFWETSKILVVSYK